MVWKRHAVSGLRQRSFQILEHGRRREPASRTIDWIIISLVVANVVATIVETVPTIAPEHTAMLQLVDRLCVVAFAVEYAARLWTAPEHPLLRGLPAHVARLRFAGSPLMIIDALALVPFVLDPQYPLLLLARLVRFLKLARYSPALATLGRVIASERRSLLACIIIFTGVLLAAAAAMHAVEGKVQPERLGDMPKAMWWAASMLAKIGGGEVVPITALGSIISAVTVMLGIGCFALPVAIMDAGSTRRSDVVILF